jgi:YebC/PmpR family DNA-binding regulatory protein
MSGHSKWSTIKRKKEKTDAQKAKIFTKIGRELAVAVRQGGGPDPDTNSRLKDCIAKAKNNNVPNENIERIIKKAVTDSNSDKYESITYEGYGPEGVAVIIQTLTDNKNRTAADIRHYFDKYCGNLGAPGCVSFMFKKLGLIVIKKRKLESNKVFEDALEAGATEFEENDETFEIYSKSEEFSSVKSNLEKKNYKFEYAEISMFPNTYTEIKNEDSIKKIKKLFEILEENDDVQSLYHNLEENNTI